MDRVKGETHKDVPALQEVARRVRRHTLDMIYRARASHIGSCFSMADILTVLYGRILRVDPANPRWPGRDRFVLSKGHGCAALYAVLAEFGFFPEKWLDTFYQDGSPLVGHVTHSHVPGVEGSTGSLGHGLSLACGMALSARMDGHPHRVFVLLSDGECDEGSTWEAALFAGHQRLHNLTAIVDYNKIQSFGTVKEVLDLDPFGAKWQSFRWATQEIDGHDVGAIVKALSQVPFEPNQPTCIIAHTIKGKGVSFFEDRLLWHYRTPDEDEYRRAAAELDGHP